MARIAFGQEDRTTLENALSCAAEEYATIASQLVSQTGNHPIGSQERVACLRLAETFQAQRTQALELREKIENCDDLIGAGEWL